MATITKTKTYTQKDFEQIINKGINYTIPIDILNNIRKLEDKVKQSVAHSAATTTYRHHHTSTTHTKPGTTQGTTQSGGGGTTATNKWKTEKPIAVTVAIKSTTPLHQIKLLLNKLSSANYEKLHSEILAVLELTPEIGNEIIAFLSRTVDMSMSNLYMQLWLSLENKHPEFFGPILENFWVQYEEHWREKIPGMAPNEENEDYYRFIKSMTELRGKSMFLAQWCMGRNEKARGIDMIQSLFRQMNIVCDEKCGKKKTQTDEWTEQIFIWMKVLRPQNQTEKEKQIWTEIEKFSQIQIKEVPNMTSRSKFKLGEIRGNQVFP